MSSDVIQAKYDQLDRIAKLFRRHEEPSQRLLESLKKSTRALHDNGWQGKGAASFVSEMEESILPAVARLQFVMYKSATTVRQISDILRDAEELAAQPFASQEASTTDFNNLLQYLGDEAADLKSTLLSVVPWLGQGKPTNVTKPRPPVALGYPHTADNLQAADPQDIKNISTMINKADRLIKHKTPESIALGNMLLQATIMYAGISHGIDIRQAAAFDYDPTFSGEGKTNQYRGVKIGPRALIDATNNFSASKLAATVFHEMVHVDQYVAHKHFGRRTDCRDTSCVQLYHVDEAEAYTMVLQNKKKLGLARHDIKDFEDRLRDEHVAVLPPRIQGMINNGEFEKARKLIDPGY